MQEDYEIIVIGSLFIRLILIFVKISPKMQEIAFLRKSNIFWGSMPRRLDSVNLIDPIVTGLYARMRNFVCLFGEEYSYTVHL